MTAVNVMEPTASPPFLILNFRGLSLFKNQQDIAVGGVARRRRPALVANVAAQVKRGKQDR